MPRKATPKPTLRAVGEDETSEPEVAETKQPPTLLEAIETGRVLDMLLAQRRIIAEALVGAQDNTRPQFNNELNKLHRLIAEEEAREKVAAEEAAQAAGAAQTPPVPFDASAD